jgi:anthranilate phosphoribosyltransferase
VRVRNALEQLLTGQHLSQLEAAALLTRLTAAQTHPAVTGAVLAALRAKGVVAEELRGFADGMRALALRPQIPQGVRAIDIVGTGGDASGSLSISTGTALLTAACGLPVVKHGNRSISSKCGSGDVLEALGVRIPMDEATAGRCLAATDFTFLFAPYYHPAMKAVAQARAALGVRTIFNILGPLTNPAAPPLYVIGAYSPEVARLMADAVSGMPIERAFVVHGSHGWDEPTPVGPFMLFDVHPGHVAEQVRDPHDFGLARCRNEDLAGGDAQHNAQALRAVLEGKDRGPHRDCLLLGAALALEVAGRTRASRDGIEVAAAAIDSGAAARTLAAVADFARVGAGAV